MKNKNTLPTNRKVGGQELSKVIQDLKDIIAEIDTIIDERNRLLPQGINLKVTNSTDNNNFYQNGKHVKMGITLLHQEVTDLFLEEYQKQRQDEGLPPPTLDNLLEETARQNPHSFGVC